MDLLRNAVVQHFTRSLYEINDFAARLMRMHTDGSARFEFAKHNFIQRINEHSGADFFAAATKIRNDLIVYFFEIDHHNGYNLFLLQRAAQAPVWVKCKNACLFYSKKNYKSSSFL